MRPAMLLLVLACASATVAIAAPDDRLAPLQARAREGGDDGHQALRELYQLDPGAAWRLGLALLSAPDDAAPTGSHFAARAVASFDWSTPPSRAVAIALAAIEERFPTDVNQAFGCGNSIGQVQEYHDAFLLLTRIGKPALPMLHRLAVSRDAVKRRNALFVLKAIPDPSNVPVLERALADPDAEVRTIAIWLLGLQAGCDRADAWEPMLRDPDPRARTRAVRALAECGRRVAIPALIEQLRSADFGPTEPQWSDGPRSFVPTMFELQEWRFPVLLLEVVTRRKTQWRLQWKPEDGLSPTLFGEPRDHAEWSAWWLAQGGTLAEPAP